MSNLEDAHTVCERLRKLYLRLEDKGERGSDTWRKVRALDDRIGSRQQLDHDMNDAKALLAQERGGGVPA